MTFDDPDYICNVLSAEFARTLDNGHSFLPARSRLPYVRVTFFPEFVSATATDGYAGGHDFCPTEYVEGRAPLTVGIARDDAAALAKAARADKKGTGRISVTVAQVVTYTDTEGNATTVEALPTIADEAAWQAVDDLLHSLEDRGASLPQTVLFDPGLLMRFSKVKCEKGDRAADLRITGPHDPVMVRIGPTFRGFVMPIDRGTYEANSDDDETWTD